MEIHEPSETTGCVNGRAVSVESAWEVAVSGVSAIFSDDEPDGAVAGAAAPQSVEAPAATVTVITRAAAAGVAKLEVLWMLDMCSGIFKRV